MRIRHHLFWTLRIVVLANLLALASCATGTELPRHTTDELRQFQQIVTTLAAPSMEGRGAGTAGLDRARDDLVERFAAAGLQPAFVTDAQASYTQPLSIKLGVQVKHQSLEILSDNDATDATVVPAQAGQQFNALGFSASVPFDGQLIFVGYGIVDQRHGYDSYRGLDADTPGHWIAVAFRYEPQDEHGKSRWAGQDGVPGRWTDAASLPNKAQWAKDHGAAALLVVNPPSQDQGDLKSTRYSVAPENAPIPVLHISSTLFDEIIRLAGRDPAKVVPVLEQRADRGKGEPEILAPVIARGRVALEYPEAVVANVAGWIPGQGELADQVVVVGAHYDHLGYGEVGSLSEVHQIHPGADDNASGVAGLVLLAQRFVGRDRDQPFAASSAVERHESPRRTLLFAAFSGEERGLLGSGYFVKHLDDLHIASPHLVAMLNFDMIGRVTDRRLHVIGVGSSDRWEEVLTDAAGQVDLDVRSNADPFGGSDHMSFLVRQVPALHFFSGSHSDYHRISDTADKINAHGALKTIDLTDIVLDRLLHDPQRLAFVHTSEADPHATALAGSGSGSGRVFLGLVPDYATLDGDDGCGLSGIVPGSPAQAGGLRADDVIVKWNQKPVLNVRGLTAMLYGSQPGDDVQLQIRREGKLMELKVTLGQRKR